MFTDLPSPTIIAQPLLKTNGVGVSNLLTRIKKRKEHREGEKMQYDKHITIYFKKPKAINVYSNTCLSRNSTG